MRIRFNVGSLESLRRVLAAVATLATVIPSLAQELPGAASAHFTIPHQANDAGGGRSASARFEIISSIAPLGDFAVSAAPVTLKSGFPGQLNESPLVTDDQVTAAAGSLLRIPASSILVNDSDAEGDALQLISVASVSSNGVPLGLLGAFIEYNAPPGQTGNDTFTYTVFDGLDYSVGAVVVTFSQPERITLGILLPALGPGPVIQVHGLPGHAYQLQTTGDLVPPIRWTNLGPPVVAPANGLIEQLNPSPLAQSFYRAIKP